MVLGLGLGLEPVQRDRLRVDGQAPLNRRGVDPSQGLTVRLGGRGIRVKAIRIRVIRIIGGGRSGIHVVRAFLVEAG